MKKFFIAIFIITSIVSLPAFAEKIPVKLENIALISTHHDEVQLGDFIPFKVVNDVYVNHKLYIKKGTKALGLVDFVQDNGWAGYGAEVRLKNFITKDTNDKIVAINYPIILDGNAETFASTVNYAADKSILLTLIGGIGDVFMFIRGHELGIKPNQATFNVFIEK